MDLRSLLLHFLNILAILGISSDSFGVSSVRCHQSYRGTDEAGKGGKAGDYIELVVKARPIVVL